MKRIIAALAAGLATLAFAFPFAPVWPPSNLTVTASAQNITLPTGSAPASYLSTVPDFGLYNYAITVSGTQDVYLRCDGTTATTSNAMRFVPGVWSFALPKATTTCSVIAGATGSSISIILGWGG